ncbi:RdgB/HAM1 family non-canonical purine NTP pyrophosphatase [Candidatus Gottesmanbacteria bacterium]|nr:RdgB/HAM1 family non-canonical purine NTP pyrophosphatase [Candidatus Gottesmanbacteria bacterium]
MKTLLLATKNPGKISEMMEILKDVPFRIQALRDFSFNEDIEEKGMTFEENATLKAMKVGEKFSVLTLADDSGLEIDALNGRPGVFSARYTDGSDEDRVKKVLIELKGIPKDQRTARFIAVVALFNPVSRELEKFKGVNEGYITDKPKGANGFGYDPIFFNPIFGKTNAQVTLGEKNRVSHRSIALRKSIPSLMRLK